MGHRIGSPISRQMPAVIAHILPNLSDIGAIPPMNALEILRETVRILRHDPSTYMSILVLLICPVSAAFLSNFLLNQSFVATLGHRSVLLAVTSGLPPSRFLKQMCHYLAGTIVSSVFCFPLLITFLLLARASIAYSVACGYAGKKVVISEFKGMAGRILKRLVLTYICYCAAIVSCLAVFIMLIVAFCTSFSALGYPPVFIIYPALLVLFGFSAAYAHIIVVCNLAAVMSVMENAAGPMALLRSMRLVKGQLQAGLVIVFGAFTGLAFIEGLFEHRVKTLSYGDGSSRIWEGPLLILMYSFVVLIDYMMIAVFYFTCRSSNMEGLSGNAENFEELKTLSSDSIMAE